MGGLFEPAIGSEMGFKARTESSYEYLRRSGMPEILAIREELEKWFRLFPPPKQSRIFVEDFVPKMTVIIPVPFSSYTFLGSWNDKDFRGSHMYLLIGTCLPNPIFWVLCLRHSTKPRSG